MSRKVIEIDSTITELVIRIAPVAQPHFRGERGVDVSKWQGTVNWEAIAKTGITFAGIRATMGASGKDEMFARNWAGAKQAGLQRLAYHYFANNTDALPQLENFIRVLGDDIGELPVVLDVEPTAGQVIADKFSNTMQVSLWLSECEKRLGRRPIIYTNGWAWGNCTNVPVWSKDYPLWLAQYTNLPVPSIPKPWESCIIWQYSSKGDLGGTSPIDLNRYGPYP